MAAGVAMQAAAFMAVVAASTVGVGSMAAVGGTPAEAASAVGLTRHPRLE